MKILVCSLISLLVMNCATKGTSSSPVERKGKVVTMSEAEFQSLGEQIKMQNDELKRMKGLLDALQTSCDSARQAQADGFESEPEIDPEILEYFKKQK